MTTSDVYSTELDFESIKTSLKAFFAADDEFSDYDFEGSGLSNILDVLAYNTHFNALVGNMAINESFLETAQLRSSVITHALSLGYFPQSKTSSVATVNLSVNLSSFSGNKPGSITLPSGFKFNASVGGTTYVFQTREAYTATAENAVNNVYKFQTTDGSENIPIYEGTSKTKTFYVPETVDKRIYVIPDTNMDTDTVNVSVFNNKNSTSFVSYSNISEAIRITNTSRYYLLKEAPNGFYELSFGDGVLTGLTPSTANMIKVEYLSVNGSAPNGARMFTPQTGITLSDSNTYSVTTTRVAVASSGAEKQSITSIRKNAPLYYASQRRLVTATDYYSQILSNYPQLIDCIAWGGEENVPVDYGKIFISIKYPDTMDAATKTSIQDDITNNMITPLSTMSITPEYVEPTDTYIGVNVYFDFNPSKTNLTLNATQNAIKNKIISYFDENLGLFGSTFRRSLLLTEIDELDEAILSSAAAIKMIQRQDITLSTSKSYTITFPEALASPDDTEYRITSDRFVFNGVTCRVKNKLSSTTLQIVNAENRVVAPNIGEYNPTLGTVSLVNFLPTSIVSNNSYIKIIATPVKESVIKPVKNYILSLDEEETVANGTIDYQSLRNTI